MAFELPPLPYPKNALEPHISAQTLDFHHGKHHQAYVTNLNNLVKGSPMENQSLEEIIQATAKDQSKTGIFNNAAQVWNHTFFWNCMKPNGGGTPSGDVAQAIDRDLGGLAQIQGRFQGARRRPVRQRLGLARRQRRQAVITSTPNAVDPLAQGQTALLTCDVWEHAYYLDLPEPPAGFRAGLPRPSDQLGLRRPEPREGEVAGRKTDLDPRLEPGDPLEAG